jgi:high-affinity iron transporter
MLASLIIVFREVFEAGLIIGIVLAVTRTVAGRGWWISAGVTAGLLGACLVAVFAGQLSDAFAGAGQELFNAAILGLAVVMLTWHNVWMARHGRELAGEMRAAGDAVAHGTKSLAALAIVVAVAVLREGFEVVLFLYSVVVTEGGANTGILLGGVVGLTLGALVCVLTYYGLVKMPARQLFFATTLLITFLAAGMASQAVSFLEKADALTALNSVVWDTSTLLSERSIAGRALHTLIGYTDQPTQMQLLVYVATLVVMLVLMKTFRPADRPRSRVSSVA